MGQGTIILLVIFQLTRMDEGRLSLIETRISSSDNSSSRIFQLVSSYPFSFIKGKGKFCEVMHILNTISVAENYDTDWFHNIIANIFQVVLVDAPVIPPHRLSQLEPKLLLEVNAFV